MTDLDRRTLDVRGRAEGIEVVSLRIGTAEAVASPT
jgi:hypothetical protein